MKIGLLDHMGYGNLGDAATQDALVANIRSRLPGVEIVAFSLNPEDTQARHGVFCYSINHWYPGLNKSPREDEGGVSKSRGLRIKEALKEIPIFSETVRRALNLSREAAHLARSLKVLKSLDCLIIAGGGQLGELWRGPWSHPYNVFKFCLLAKLADRKLLFVNVGAGPLESTLGKAFIKWSIDLADYASFRDVESKALVERAGVKRQTFVFPDSVYALDLSTCKTAKMQDSPHPTVGINPIGFCDPCIWPKKDAAAYSQYLGKLAEISSWLVSRNYELRFFSAEASVDVHALEDLKLRLRASLSPAVIDKMFFPPCNSVQDLVTEMAGFDFIVTSKFHGVVFSHLLERPVLALSYGKKIDNLMRTTGQSQYCLSIQGFDVECFKTAFTALVEQSNSLKSSYRQITTSYSKALKAQFDEIFVAKNMRPRTSRSMRDGAVLDGSV